MNPKYLEIYYKNKLEEEKQEMELEKQRIWSNGYQTYIAIGSALGGKKYPEYSAVMKEEKKSEEIPSDNNNESRKMAAGFAAYITEFNKKFAKID